MGERKSFSVGVRVFSFVLMAVSLLLIGGCMRGGKRGQAFDLGVTNMLQESKKLGTAEQPTRPPSSG